MILRKNQHYVENYQFGWIINSYPFKVLYDNTTLPIFYKDIRKYNPAYLEASDKAFGFDITEKPILSLTNLPKNKLRFYLKSKEQFEKFKEIILILKLTK